MLISENLRVQIPAFSGSMIFLKNRQVIKISLMKLVFDSQNLLWIKWEFIALLTKKGILWQLDI